LIDCCVVDCGWLLCCCLCTNLLCYCSPGRYQDVAMELDGACAPVLIHTDPTQTEERTQKERARQRRGEKPTVAEIGAKYQKGIDLPELLVRTSKSGSITQEIFYDYCTHFVASLKEDHEPVILFLDGHASRWNTQALKYLSDNKIYLFFFASHTSIWAPPNDCGLNKRVHWAIEQACKKFRRGGRATSQEYFNQIFCLGYRIFRQAESADLLECFENNATRAYGRTGVFPLDPFAEAWMEAIDGLGAGNLESLTISYEIWPSEERMRTLTSAEAQLLRTDLDLDEDNDLGDFYCAEIQASRILAKWWGDIEKAVSEGNDEAEYSKLYLPASFATTDCEKLVVALIQFEPVDVKKIPLRAPKSAEERAKEISEMIVELTKIAQPVHISYLVDDDEESTNDTGPLDSSMDFVWMEGTAIKRKNETWSITLSNGDELSLKSEEMLSSPKVFVKNAFTELNAAERKRTISKKKRIRHTAMLKSEKEYILLAREKQKEHELEEFEKMRLGMESGEYDFLAFQGLVDRMRAPFSCEIDGVHIMVTPDDATVMLDTAALGAIKRVLVIEGGDNNNNGNNGPQRKRRKNTAAAETGLGLGHNQAHYQTDRRDRTQNAAAKATLLKQNLKEKDLIAKVLTFFDLRKATYEAAMTTRRQEEATCRIGCLAAPPVPFWVVKRTDDKKTLRLFLEMFLPKYGWGFLLKNVEVQWAGIQGIPVDLTESSVNAKAEELRRRLRAVEEAIRDATVQTNEEEPTAMNN
jgi:hypothetical protein